MYILKYIVTKCPSILCPSHPLTSLQEKHLRFVYETTTRLLSHSASQGGRPRLSVSYLASRNTHVLRECFASPTAIEPFLCRSFLFQRAKAPTREFPFPKQPPSEERQMSAKLHCLYGDMVLNWSRTRASRTYPFAASKVYDIRECTPRTRWGPVSIVLRLGHTSR